MHYPYSLITGQCYHRYYRTGAAKSTTLSELCRDYQQPHLSHVPFGKVTIPVRVVLTYFIFSCFLVFRLCTLVHFLILHVLLFQSPIYHYPYYSLVYIVGFYLTEYKLVSPSSQSSSKLHRTPSHLIVIPSYSLRTIVKVLSTCRLSSSFVVLCRFSSFLVVSHHHSRSTFSRSRLRRTGDPALYPHSAAR